MGQKLRGASELALSRAGGTEAGGSAGRCMLLTRVQQGDGDGNR